MHLFTNFLFKFILTNYQENPESYDREINEFIKLREVMFKLTPKNYLKTEKKIPGCRKCVKRCHWSEHNKKILSPTTIFVK